MNKIFFLMTFLGIFRKSIKGLSSKFQQKRETMIFREIVGDYLCLAQGVEHLPQSSKLLCFRPEGLEYHPFCDDFGPMSLSSVVTFIEQLETVIRQNPHTTIVYMVGTGKRALSNAAFLLGVYMIFKLDMVAKDVSDHFDWLDDSVIEHFKDVTSFPGGFRLTLDDCWRGVEKARALGWVDASTDGEYWGMVNIEEYRHYDSPCNGDFHEVVPGKFIAFKGPTDLGGAEFQDDERGGRTFSPAAYAAIFADDFRVKAVVRLNEAQYDAAAFEARGVTHHHLEFDDCTCPPRGIVDAFLAVAAVAVAGGGCVAVHCRAGLGRTGTLIAAYLMRCEGFTAREAMGWLRVMRPGSVIGPQQDYLCALESACAAAPEAASAPSGGPSAACPESPWAQTAKEAGGRGAGMRLAEEVASGAERRAAARAAGGASGMR